MSFPVYKYSRVELLELCDSYANVFLCANIDDIRLCIMDEMVSFPQVIHQLTRMEPLDKGFKQFDSKQLQAGKWAHSTFIYSFFTLVTFPERGSGGGGGGCVPFLWITEHMNAVICFEIITTMPSVFMQKPQRKIIIFVHEWACAISRTDAQIQRIFILFIRSRDHWAVAVVLTSLFK